MGADNLIHFHKWYKWKNILKKSNIILCEDTRRSAKLISNFQIQNKLLAYHKFNEKKIADKIIENLKKNKIISLISDAGTPAISDPGIILVNKCITEKIKVYPVPGPSSVTSAVSISGFRDQYLFFGFLKKKENEINDIFKNLSDLNYSLVFFIPAIKINSYISKLKKYFSDRKILIAREMTKMHEESIRCEVKDINNIKDNLRGELTIVLSEKIKGKNDKKEIAESVKIEIIKMLKKYSHKDVVEYICKKENLSKKIVYNFCLKQKK